MAHIQNLRFFPLVVSGGSGARPRTASGRELIDLSASWTASAFGHGNPTIAEAVHRAALTGAGSSALSAAVTGTTELAERLVNTVPVKHPERAYLGLSGGDANTAAVEAPVAPPGDPPSSPSPAATTAASAPPRRLRHHRVPGPGSLVFDYPLTEAALSGARPG
ncbi:aminotransferase class III-fold pyridoxal phosphate-dependent enzyme [Brevibacterium casei]|nr:aminotransferase class III-fold pyridoxal phosphate-dependent enzyme [Brevibacterium casei]